MEATITPPEESLRRLEEAAQGLLFPSESDYPFSPFRWGGEAPSPEGLLAAEGLPPEVPVETVAPEDLFAPVIGPEEGGELAEAERYRRLLALLRAELEDLRVYRVGRVDIDVYVLGRHPSGAWLGLRTKVVET